MNAWVVVPTLALLLGGMVVPDQAFAHALLTKSSPAANARLATLPIMIRLWYSEEPAIPLTHVVLTDSLGHVVRVGAVERDESALALHVRILGELSAGRYAVAWNTVAADDGHPSHGTFTFVVLPGAASALVPPAGMPITDSARGAGADTAAALSNARPDQEPSAETPAYVLARGVSFAALLAVIGVVAFRFLVLDRSVVDETDKATMRRLATVTGAFAAALLCIAAGARLCLQAAMITGPSDHIGSTLSVILTQTGWGGAWLLQVAVGLVALGGFCIALRARQIGWGLATLAAPLLAVSATLQGHAAASHQWRVLAVTVDSLHILGAAGWLGSLLSLVVIGLPAGSMIAASRWKSVQALVEAFSPTALAFAGLVVVTGVGSAWLRLGGLTPLWTSPYGKVLLIKLGVLLGAAGTGFYNWQRVRPALGTERATLRLSRSASSELAIGFLVLIVTGVLVAMPTPLDMPPG